MVWGHNEWILHSETEFEYSLEHYWPIHWVWSRMSLFYTLTNRWDYYTMNNYACAQNISNLHTCTIGDAACNNFGNCNASCAVNSTGCVPLQNEGIDVPKIVLITSILVAILVVLLGLVTVCWIGTYTTMKKKIRALQSTLTTANTGNRWGTN